MPRCPNGHDSNTTDYCDVCGAPIGRIATITALHPDVRLVKACPICITDTDADALFCEECGYDFTTGAKPGDAPQPLTDTIAPPNTPPVQLPPAQLPPMPSPEAGLGRPAEPVPSASISTITQPGAGTPAGNADNALSGYVSPTGVALQPTGVAPAVPSAPSSSAPSTQGAPHPASSAVSTISVPGTSFDALHPEWGRWIVEQWIDPEWYASQDTEEPIPSPGPPLVTEILTKTTLIGRPSAQRGIHPRIDCDPDTGVSRRQAELITDGQRWWVRDLDSANGTYLGRVDAPLPAMPIKGRVELSPDERIYVGAWTRLVVRPAIPGELR